MLCPTMGLQAVIITSPKCSKEKMSAIAAYGATLIVEKDYMSKVGFSSHLTGIFRLLNEMHAQ